MTRICESCKIEKPLTEFRKAKKGYLTRKCKQCSKNKCRNEGCDHVVYGNAECSECCRLKNYGSARTKPPIQRSKAWLNQCLRSTKACSPSRLKRGYRVKENDLTIDFLMDLLEKQDGLCAVSGLPLQFEYKNCCSASIDRVNPELGYLQDNVVLTCQWVNMGRNRTPIEEFKKILSRINNPNHT